jgi:hypothetical protein
MPGGMGCSCAPWSLLKVNVCIRPVCCRDLDRPADWESIKRLRKRAVLVCAPDDIWYPMHHYFDTQAAVPGIEVRNLTMV